MPGRTKRPVRLDLDIDEAVATAEPGAAVLVDGVAEAIVIRTESPYALVRQGTLHPDPIRVPMGTLTLVDPIDETDRHYKYRARAEELGEI